MGNQLVGIAPSQIYPVEHYLTGSFESDLQYESSMGSTRFFKVARARSDEGFVVVKVFVKHDPSLPLEAHAKRLDEIKKALSNAVNCLPFQRVVLTDKAGLIMREYVKHSLYDRVSTRPFLTTLEKKWITFQVLCALHQCHKQKICHGDIKLENILITSWNWILLSDFASFKPTYLPEDNPADYTYFFDTSRRRTCYIAPERFVKTLNSESNMVNDGPLMTDSLVDDSFIRDGPCSTGNLLPEMDIFSAGCALLELWTEGTAPFEFSQLLSYRSGDMELVTIHLQLIENIHLRDLLASMLNKNPKERRSADTYLDEERGRLFPEYFYSFLQSYLQIFSSIPILPPDDKIMTLYLDIKYIVKMVTDQNEMGDNDLDKLDKEKRENDGLILITTVVTSCIRGLHYCNTKMCCLEILQQLAEYTSSETILDRILPYILHLASDSAPSVRVCALDTLTACLCMVHNLPRSDANVFPEYVLPTIAPMATDSSVIVRVAYAKNIATLAETAVDFLEQTQLSDMPTPRYESELSTLHEMLQQTISNLLTDSQPIVKQTLMESGITKLCVFFGRQKANDIILSHMITFLNDKDDKNLRGSFFDCIVGVAAFVGWQCSEILTPLLQQGLSDPEEFVIAKSIRSMTALTDLDLIQKSGLTEFISDCACFLNHPNMWIRHEVCGLISTAAKHLSAIDVQCKIMPAITNYLKSPLIQVDKPEILLDCLHTPVPRNIYDDVVRFSDVSTFFRLLQERRECRNSSDEGVLPQYGEIGTSLKNFFRRLISEGLNDLSETQLLYMKSHIIKLHKYKTAENKTNLNGRLVLVNKKQGHDYSLIEQRKNDLRKSRKSENDNSDWQHMFSAMDATASPTTPSNDSGNTAGMTSSPPSTSGTQIQATPSSSLAEYSMPERSFLQERISECRQELESLQTKMKSRFQALASIRDFNPSVYYSAIPPSWHMNGTLVAHLHEHKSSVTKLAPLKSFSSLFASASDDGTVRLWDCSKMDGHQSVNRSKQAYSANTPICAIAAADSGQSLAVGGKDGTLLLLRIDPNSSRMALQQALHLTGNSRTDKSIDDGPVVDMQSVEHVSNSLIVYATLYGAIVCWDIRMPGIAWRLQNHLRDGVITSFCLDPTNSWLATGTSSGQHICWDLRFKIQIAKIRHPRESRIRKVLAHPTEPSLLISASHGNNEVSIWNIETGDRQVVLWASYAPPFSYTGNPSSTVCGLLSGVVDRSPFLLTGGVDQRIRYYDLMTPKNSSLIVPAAGDHGADVTYTYDSRPIEGTHVIYEIRNPGSSAAGSSGAAGASSSNRSTVDEQTPRSGPEFPSPGHHNVITDLLLCKTHKQTFIASSSRDGVIKLWK